MTGRPASTSLATPSIRCSSAQQGPVAHRSAIDHGGHAAFHELASLAHERVEVGRAVGSAWRHQSRDHAGEDIRGHGGRSCVRRRGREMRSTMQHGAGGLAGLAGISGGKSGIRTISPPMKSPVDLGQDFLAALGRPFLGEELFDRIADTVVLSQRSRRPLCRGQRHVGSTLQSRRQSRSDRTDRARGLSRAARRLLRRSGSARVARRGSRSPGDWSCTFIPMAAMAGA